MGRKVIVVLGPTASGKTKIGIELALELNGEIISADSRQFYKNLSIGTAKPSVEERALVKHHFIDFVEPEDYFNASMFEKAALGKISEMFDRGIQPIVVGGSGLYIMALVEGIFDNGETDPEIREEIKHLREEKGNEFIYEKLIRVDPAVASTMIPQNWKRVMRALEVYYSTGKSILDLQKKHKRELEFDFFQFGLSWEREKLYKRIEERVDSMFENGLLEEAEKFRDKGYSPEINALNTVGYKELFLYFDGSITLDRAKELIKRNTRRFAKRQFTWFKKDENINWFSINSDKQLLEIKNKIINQIRSENEREN